MYRFATLLALLLVALGSLLTLTAQAQCVPDSLVNSTPGGIYPSTLPAALGCQYYEEVISFKFPQDTSTTFAGQPITVNFNYFTVDSITGLPQGMDWECNLTPDCRYVVHPDSSDLDTVGCVTIFGTPTVPATYSLVVHVTANVDLFGNPSPNPVAFSRPLQVTPCEFEGECYTLALSDNCAPAILNITNNLPANGRAGYTYQWEVSGPTGQVYQTGDENPFPQMLTEGGDYTVDFQVDIDTIGFVLQDLEILQVGCDDNFLGGNAPDLYWTITAPNQQVIVNTQNNIVTNATLPLNMGVSNLLLDTGQYRIRVWDDEPIGPPTGCATGGANSGASLFFTVPPAQTGTFVLISGNLHIRFTIDNPIQTITCQDTIRVNTPPTIPTLFREGDSLLVDSTFFCANGQTVLSTNSGDSLLWYQDESLITGIHDSLLVVDQAGLYRVEAIDRNTFCRTSSATVRLDSVLVQAPSVSFDASTEIYQVDNPVGSAAYRWFDANDSLVETGDSFEPAVNGDYYAVAVDTLTSCASTPTEVFTFVTGLPGDWLNQWSVAPNPSSGLLTLRAQMPQPQSVSLQVFDLAGRAVWQRALGTQPMRWQATVDLSALPLGLYLLRLQAGERRVQTRLILR